MPADHQDRPSAPGPSEGQDVAFTLKPTDPRAARRQQVAVAAPARRYVEVDADDNTATSTLAPDVVLAALQRQTAAPSCSAAA